MNKFARSFSLISSKDRLMRWAAVILFYGYFLYVAGGFGVAVVLILLPWALLGIVFAPFAFVPFSFVRRGHQNFMSRFMFWGFFSGVATAFGFLLNIVTLCMGVMLSAVASPLLGPVVWAYYFFKEMR